MSTSERTTEVGASTTEARRRAGDCAVGDDCVFGARERAVEGSPEACTVWLAAAAVSGGDLPTAPTAAAEVWRRGKAVGDGRDGGGGCTTRRDRSSGAEDARVPEAAAVASAGGDAAAGGASGGDWGGDRGGDRGGGGCGGGGMASSPDSIPR